MSQQKLLHDPPSGWLQTSVGSLLTMCLSSEAHAHYLRLAREMDDERLENLDRHYSCDLGRLGTTVDMQLHSIVRYEMAVRRERRIARLRRSLWLSSRRGRCVEAGKRWLVRHRLWSSARQRVIEPASSSLIKRWRWLIWALLLPLVALERLSGLMPQRKMVGPR